MERYLHRRWEIFCRLGLYLLSKYPARFRTLVAEVLGQPANLDMAGVHHEFFLLLERGFEHLMVEEQTTLVAAILLGPLPERLAELAE